MIYQFCADKSSGSLPPNTSIALRTSAQHIWSDRNWSDPDSRDSWSSQLPSMYTAPSSFLNPPENTPCWWAVFLASLSRGSLFRNALPDIICGNWNIGISLCRFNCLADCSLHGPHIVVWSSVLASCVWPIDSRIAHSCICSGCIENACKKPFKWGRSCELSVWLPSSPSIPRRRAPTRGFERMKRRIC